MIRSGIVVSKESHVLGERAKVVSMRKLQHTPTSYVRMQTQCITLNCCEIFDAAMDRWSSVNIDRRRACLTAGFSEALPG